MTTSAGPPVTRRPPRKQLVGAGVVIVPLTVAAAAAGGLRWPLPDRVFEGWRVAAVPPSLAALLAATTAVCLVAATVFTMRVTRLRPPEPAALAWLAVVLVAAAVLGWNALVMAANGGWADFGPHIPVLDWTFTSFPALAAGAVTARRGAAVASVAAAGTGIVTVPLYALGVALLGSRDPFAAYLWQPLWAATSFGALPLAVAVAVCWSWARPHGARSRS